MRKITIFLLFNIIFLVTASSAFAATAYDYDAARRKFEVLKEAGYVKIGRVPGEIRVKMPPAIQQEMLARYGDQKEIEKPDIPQLRWLGIKFIRRLGQLGGRGGDVYAVTFLAEIPVANPLFVGQYIAAEERYFNSVRQSLESLGALTEPVALGETQDLPPSQTGGLNDPLIPEMWHLEATNVLKLFTEGIRGSNSPNGLKVVVMDTGATLHEDLLANVNQLESKSFYGGAIFQDEVSHGIRTAGTACAVGDNGIGITGMAPTCNLLIIKVGTTGYTPSRIPYGYIDDSAVLEALYHLNNNVSGVLVVNMSFVTTGVSQLIEDEIAAGKDRMLFVAAAGNDGQNDYVGFPARLAQKLENIIAVGAYEPNGLISPFSNWDRGVPMVFAPGNGIKSLVRLREYENWRGTSAATPVVTGVPADLVAWLMKKGVKIDASVIKQVRSALQKTALGYLEGIPKLDAWAAYEYLKPLVPPTPRPNRPPVVTLACNATEVVSGQGVNCLATASDPDGDKLTFKWSPEGRFTFYDEPGRVIFETAGINATPGNLPVSVMLRVVVDDGRGGASTATQWIKINAPAVEPRPSHPHPPRWRHGPHIPIPPQG